MDAVTLGAAIQKSRNYTDSVALNGVPVNYPKIDPTTRHWQIYDPIANKYIDTGIIARAISPVISSETGNWLVWNDITGMFDDSGIHAAGSTGPQGQQGVAGSQGPQGIQGIQGIPGPSGPQGENGANGLPGPQGTPGIQGQQGPKGEVGPPANIRILGSYQPDEAYMQGDVISYVPFGNSYYCNVDNTKGVPPSDMLGDTIWALYVMRGPQGEQGPSGGQGIQGPVGPQGIQGPVGSAGPQGEQGVEGPQGKDGPMGPKGEQGIPGVPLMTVPANSDYATARIRNISAGTTDLVAGTSPLPSGDIYLVYEL